MKDKIIEYIKRNKVSTTEVADCLGKSGAIPNLMAVNRGHFCVGEVVWTYALDESNWTVHRDISDIEPGCILMIDVINCKKRAVIGELVAKYVLLYRQAQAIVVRGNIRDAGNIAKENYAIWCEGFSPVGCFNTEVKKDIDDKQRNALSDKYSGAIAVCDLCGVVLIPRHMQSYEFYQDLQNIEEQEDIWFDCIDRRKWDTFDTVCNKKYLQEGLL